MEFRGALRLGLKGLLLHKVRSALSMLGIIFGVASVVAVIAVSEGAKGEILKQLAALGADNIIVRGLDWRTSDRERIKRARIFSEGFTVREAADAAASAPHIAAYSPIRTVKAGVRYGEKPLNAQVMGVASSFLNVMNFSLGEGRWFNPRDEEGAKRVCVLEEQVRHDLGGALEGAGGEGREVLGQTLTIDHEPYAIIGVLRAKEETDKKYDVAEVDLKAINRRIYIPLSCALARCTREPLAGEANEIVFRCRSAAAVQQTARILERFFLRAHRMEQKPAEERDFSVLIARELLQKIEASQKIFNVVMLCSAGISLLVGGIGIMNIMLANVTERRKEVGIRRAVGARRADILRQFLLESLIICLLGGAAGCLLGLAFTGLVQSLTGWETRLAWWGMALAVGVSLADGLLFGTFPAWKAATLDPIDALKEE